MKSPLSLTFVFCLSSAIFLSGCDYLNKKKEIIEKRYFRTAQAECSNAAKPASAESVAESKTVGTEAEISGLAMKYFPDSPSLRAEWIKKQMSAYGELSKFIPDIPIERYAEIRKLGAEKFPDNYSDRLKYIVEQSDFYSLLTKTKDSMPQSDFATVYAFAKMRHPQDYKKQREFVSDWKSALASIDDMRRTMPAADGEKIRENVIKSSGGDANAALKEFEKQLAAKREFENFGRGAAFIGKREAESLKNEIAKRVHGDYVARLELAKRAQAALEKNSAADLSSVLPNLNLPTDGESEITSEAKRIFAESIFSKRGAENEIHAAVLVKMNGKTVVLATKEFIPEKFPVVFANGRGKIKCSKGYISEELPILMLIPDEEPEGFTPLELVTRGESQNITDKNLFMIAPDRGGYCGMTVSVFSEDEKYLNLTSATAPSVTRRTNVRPLGRAGDKFLVSVTEIADVGDNAIVIDIDSKKLVSMAVRVYNPGVFSHHGKTGSIIGHEKMEIPDFTTFVRQFDGAVNKTFIPFSSIRFVRAGAMENWKPLDIKKFSEQKNEIRIFTDENNDFLMFFKSNTFAEALRSRRLCSIAERYRKPLLQDRLSRESYERSYRGYMIEVSYAIKRSMQKYIEPEKFYSIYRQELLYQLKLRQSMSDYISESVKDQNVLNVLHTDLTTRYNNNGVNSERIGGSVGGGY